DPPRLSAIKRGDDASAHIGDSRGPRSLVIVLLTRAEVEPGHVRRSNIDVSNADRNAVILEPPRSDVARPILDDTTPNLHVTSGNRGLHRRSRRSALDDLRLTPH